MGKIGLIIRREYLTRVRKRSFIVMSILGPLLMATMLIVPIYLATLDSDEEKTIRVLDETGWFYKKFKGNEKLKFTYSFEDLETAKNQLIENEDHALLYIPKPSVAIPSNAILYSERQPNVQVLSQLSNTLEQVVKQKKLEASGIDPNILSSVEKTDFDISTIKIKEDGEEKQSHTGVTMVLGIFAGLMIYFFIFIFGALVMRGVIEEKSSRIVEIIISSVKPFQLMMGKVLGIAMVGLTQFLIWVIFTFAIVTTATGFFSDQLPTNAGQQFNPGTELIEMQKPQNTEIAQEELTQVFDALFSVNYGVMIFSFIVYFIGGYLLYAALMAAIGSAVDNETDTQQFMLPITIPMIFSIIMAQFVINNPDSSLAFWLSIIPLTSPVIMMVRIPFGVPYTELALSMGLLILGFLGAIWLAGRIYKTGILMYGSKVNYKTLWKWIRMR
ncbi:MAG: ABC transporter permease [Bacteroidales bacterium]|nr:ABC transporter permease [Bacteroidales bacterium]MCF8351471.1 ABC transporter permease [Bacteroidales bacterium]MCF8375065.1 ABC transporter permease [Bacteroidales bacterium]MCF8399971.1 ABC transporter permease [Bacteroidales bacterium]